MVQIYDILLKKPLRNVEPAILWYDTNPLMNKLVHICAIFPFSAPCGINVSGRAFINNIAYTCGLRC